MKIKTLMIALGLVTAIGLTGCGGESTSAPAPADDAEQVEEVVDTTQGEVSTCYVKINDCVLTSDYSGNKVIVIYYDFTNNGSKEISPMAAVYNKAFQDGVELSKAFLVNNSAYESGRSMKDVKPGATLENVPEAFVLDGNAEVSFEVGTIFKNAVLTKSFEVQ